MSNKQKDDEKGRSHRLRAEETKRKRIAGVTEVYGEFNDFTYDEIKRMSRESKKQRDREGRQQRD